MDQSNEVGMLTLLGHDTHLQILSFLSPQELVNCSRVDKSFRDASILTARNLVEYYPYTHVVKKILSFRSNNMDDIQIYNTVCNGPTVPVTFSTFLGNGLIQRDSHLGLDEHVLPHPILRDLSAVAIGGKVMTHGQHFAQFNVPNRLTYGISTHIGIIRHIPLPRLNNLQHTIPSYFSIFKPERLSLLKQAAHTTGEMNSSTIDCLLMNSFNGVIKVSKWGGIGHPVMTTSSLWPSIGRGSIELLLDLSVGKLYLHRGGTESYHEPYRYEELENNLTGAYSWCIFCKPRMTENVPYVVECNTFDI